MNPNPTLLHIATVLEANLQTASLERKRLRDEANPPRSHRSVARQLAGSVGALLVQIGEHLQGTTPAASRTHRADAAIQG